MACGAAVQLVLAMPRTSSSVPRWRCRGPTGRPARALLVRAQVDVVEAAEGGEILEMTNGTRRGDGAST